MNAFIWWTACAALVALCLWALFGDWWLIANGRPPITDYLRKSPWAFWSSALLVLAGVAVLAVHLFVVAKDGEGLAPVVPPNNGQPK